MSLATMTKERIRAELALDAVRFIQALYVTQGDVFAARDLFLRRFPISPSNDAIQKAITKTAVPGAMPTAGSWGAPFMPLSPMQALVEYARAFSILLRLLATRVAFSVSVPREATVLTAAGWRGAGAAKLVGRGAFDSTSLPPRSAAGILVVTEELLKLTGPAVEQFLRNALARGISAFVDAQLLDPSVAAVANVSPASITNGVTATTFDGDPQKDFANLIRDYVDRGGRLESAALAMSSANSVALNLSHGDKFRDLTTEGGTLAGIRVVASDSAGDVIALIDTQRLLVADDGEARVDASRQVTLEMSDAPTNNSATPTATNVVSLWQTNSVALRAERIVNWEAGPVAYLEGSYLESVGSP